VDVYDDCCNKIGTKELHFSPSGYTIEDSCYPPWFAVVSIKSNCKEDRRLLTLWDALQEAWEEGQVWGWNPGNSCWTQTVQWGDYGIDWDIRPRPVEPPYPPWGPAPGPPDRF
jgi:hypothetical protein